MNMSYDKSLSIGRPRALVHLATNSFFRMISKILPPNTSVVEICNDCNAVPSSQNHENEEILNCKCYRFYRPVVELFLYLPSDLRKQTLEIAQKELDNSSSFRVLLGRLSIQCTIKLLNCYRNTLKFIRNFLPKHDFISIISAIWMAFFDIAMSSHGMNDKEQKYLANNGKLIHAYAEIFL